MQTAPSLFKTCTDADNLARCAALESLVNDMADDTWDNKAVNRTSAIHFLDEDEDEDDEKVRPAKFKGEICLDVCEISYLNDMNNLDQ